ncbi:MAG: hypothetical protein P4L16_07410 [Chlamydiales bacterium]|nr:hypothetical protein [Chlamydiales bacterium]
MLLITFATIQEASPSIDVLKAFYSKENECYLFEKGRIVITGIGSIAASARTMHHLTECKEVWNFGLAGALKKNYEIGSLLSIQSASKWLHFPEELDSHSKTFSQQAHPSLNIKEQGAHLISSDYPIHNPQIKENLALTYDLVDMEGYGIAYAASLANKPCSLWKIVSDFASTDGQKLIKQHINSLAINISHFLAELNSR